jgi:hypothetical protein
MSAEAEEEGSECMSSFAVHCVRSEAEAACDGREKSGNDSLTHRCERETMNRQAATSITIRIHDSHNT